LSGLLVGWLLPRVQRLTPTPLFPPSAPQLCINYTNETLQQQFNKFVFKMEQEEYEREKIEWSFIHFPDNQDCLDLIEGRPNGILAMLDDECRLPKGSDDKLAGRLQKELGSHARFFVTKKMVAEKHFGVRHYAGEVAYNTFGFLEKNKDQLPREATNLFLSSSSAFVQALFADTGAPGGAGAGVGAGAARGRMPAQPLSPPKPATGSGAASASVATQFKSQLHELMNKIQTTRPHYIRTIKPNDEALPDRLTRLRVNEQLRYGGVLEAVRVARSGYPVRLPHTDFFTRYRCLATAAIKTVVVEEVGGSALLPRKSAKVLALPQRIGGDNQEANRQWCERVLEGIMAVQEAAGAAVEAHKILPADSVQLGKTKVFLRKVAYEVLEFKRISRLAEAATKITSFFRGAALRREYMLIRAAARFLQRVVRGHLARRVAASLRRERAAARLQTAYRAAHARQRYARFRHAVLRLQCRLRGRRGRRVAHALASERAARRLQAWGRAALAARRYHRYLHAVVALQCGWRVCAAKRQLRQLRVEARSIGKMQKDNEQLKEELARLKQMLEKKAAGERAEKERQLEEERRAAAAATLEELERWKQRCAEAEKRLAEEQALRKEAQARAEQLQAQATEKDQQLAQERTAKALALDRAQRCVSRPPV
jgi:myosin-5